MIIRQSRARLMRPQVKTEFFDLPRPRVIAHRGASGDFPENTLPAFAAARDLGALYIELDVHMTRDGRVVVAHDDNLKRVGDADGLIREMALADLSRVDVAHNFTPSANAAVEFPFRGRGIGVPELEEVFAACPDEHFIVEIKQTSPSLVEALIGVIDRAAMRRRVLVASEHQAPIDEFRAEAPDIPTNFPTAEVAAFLMSLPPDAPRFAPRGRAMQIPPEHGSWKIVTPETVAAAHRIGVEMHIWTINEEAEMRTLLALGVDGLITNFPARLLKLLARR
jgi:glycerophosphoryl diester phosphodiesterase